MARLLRKYVDVAGSASIRTLETILTGIAGGKRHVVGLIFVEVTSTLLHNAILEAWLDQQQILSMPLVALLTDKDEDTRLPDQLLELNLDLPEGVGLEVGHISDTSPSDFQIVAVYTDE